MIIYKSGGINFICNLVKRKGSVFPRALMISIPASLVTGTLSALIWSLNYLVVLQDVESVMNNNAAWGGFSFFVGFLVVFRTSQAYNRFWEGTTSTHKMGAEWFDACAALVSFCRHSGADREKILNFQNLIVRLFSMLHAVALGELEDCGEIRDFASVAAFSMELIDGEGIDEESLRMIRDSDAKVELVFQWIQSLIVENIKTGVMSIPPPILTRSYQELANGMVAFHDALKISKVPFPFPYAQTCDALLVMHWFIVPFVVSQWCHQPWWAFIFAFIQVFTLWSLNLIAVEIENPFGTDPNDVDGVTMQLQMNNNLRLLLGQDVSTIPTLRKEPGVSQADLVWRVVGNPADRRMSFVGIWEALYSAEQEEEGFAKPARNPMNFISRRYSPDQEEFIIKKARNSSTSMMKRLSRPSGLRPSTTSSGGSSGTPREPFKGVWEPVNGGGKPPGADRIGAVCDERPDITEARRAPGSQGGGSSPSPRVEDRPGPRAAENAQLEPPGGDTSGQNLVKFSETEVTAI